MARSKVRLRIGKKPLRNKPLNISGMIGAVVLGVASGIVSCITNPPSTRKRRHYSRSLFKGNKRRGGVMCGPGGYSSPRKVR